MFAAFKNAFAISMGVCAAATATWATVAATTAVARKIADAVGERQDAKASKAAKNAVDDRARQAA